MGREIRRVPPDWKHPKNERGDYIPLYDKDYESAAQSWTAEFVAFLNGTHPEQEQMNKWNIKHYWEWTEPPDQDTCRERQWGPVEATAYQVYEDVSEGTPVGPVLETETALRDWLLAQGWSAAAVDGFIADRWAPSFVMIADRETGKPMAFIEGIESCALPKVPKQATSDQ